MTIPSLGAVGQTLLRMKWLLRQAPLHNSGLRNI